MLKQKAILATFNTLSLEEKRKMLNELVDSAGILIRDYRSTELGGEISIADTLEDFLKLSPEEQFAYFVSRVDNYYIFKKEDIEKHYKLYQIVKEKCNIGIWRHTFRGDECYRDTKDEFYLGFDPKRTDWEGFHVNMGYDDDNTFTPMEKEDFFNNMLYEASKCNICIPKSKAKYQGSILQKTYSIPFCNFPKDEEEFTGWWNISI